MAALGLLADNLPVSSACNEAWLAAGANTTAYNCMDVYQSCQSASGGSTATATAASASSTAGPSTGKAVQCQEAFTGKSYALGQVRQRHAGADR